MLRYVYACDACGTEAVGSYKAKGWLQVQYVATSLGNSRQQSTIKAHLCSPECERTWLTSNLIDTDNRTIEESNA